jgi:hypothetical protein
MIDRAGKGIIVGGWGKGHYVNRGFREFYACHLSAKPKYICNCPHPGSLCEPILSCKLDRKWFR